MKLRVAKKIALRTLLPRTPSEIEARRKYWDRRPPFRIRARKESELDTREGRRWVREINSRHMPAIQREVVRRMTNMMLYGNEEGPLPVF